MANANTPFGLKPVRDARSGQETGGLEMFFHPASDATALFIGDPVIKNGSADAAGIAGVIRAGATGAITGTVMGFVPDGTVDQAGFGAASTAYYVLVSTDPSEMFIIQENAGMAAADIGLNANLATGSGNAYSKKSGFVLDAATKATTATLQLKIMGLAPIPGNDFGAFNKLLVMINNSTEATASAGV
jgi:hypothetical protein